MGFLEYLTSASDRARQTPQPPGLSLRHIFVVIAVFLGVTGAVFVGQFFESERTTTKSTGALWWKHETTTTTAIPVEKRLPYLFIGLALIAVAAVCVYVPIMLARRRAGERKYRAILTGVERIPIDRIAGITGATQAAVVRDIQRMIDSGAIDDVYIDRQAGEVVSKRYVPKVSHKVVVTCRACNATNEMIVGIPRACAACGEPLVASSP